MPEIHEALLLALRALTDGMVDVPAALRNSRCAKMSFAPHGIEIHMNMEHFTEIAGRWHVRAR